MNAAGSASAPRRRATASVPRRRVAARGACAAACVAGLISSGFAAAPLIGDRPTSRDFGITASAAADPVDYHSTTTPGLSLPRPPAGAGQPAVPFVPGPPIRIEIPALKVSASIDAVGTVDGELAIPPDPVTVGWWPGAALPGSRSGAVVLGGHVDSATRGLGAFFRLTELRAGDVVTLTAAGGGQLGYQVIGRRSYPKAAGLPADLFAGTGAPRLVLITCGGRFDDATLSYRDNVVVFAAPPPD